MPGRWPDSPSFGKTGRQKPRRVGAGHCQEAASWASGEAAGQSDGWAGTWAERGTEREGRPCAWYRGGQDGHLAGGSGARAGSEREMRLSFAISLPASALVSVPIFPSRSLFLCLSLSASRSAPFRIAPSLSPLCVAVSSSVSASACIRVAVRPSVPAHLRLPLCLYFAVYSSVSLSVCLSLPVHVPLIRLRASSSQGP